MLEVIAVAAVAVLASVGIHYEFLQLASVLARAKSGPRRPRVAMAIVLAVVAHLVEVGIFTLGWAWCLSRGTAELNVPTTDLVEMYYFSGSVYTSLGFGDIVPLSNGRVLTVVETVTGLVLIAWTASFTYLEMQENWRVSRA